jgi:cytochrome c553
MFHQLLRALVFGMAGLLPLQAAATPAVEDTMAQRTLACTACHGKQGRAGPDGYYPRLAGKPAAYLYNQLLNFRDGQRHYGLMTGLIEPLSDAYLMEIARYFSQIEAPYPRPVESTAPKSVLERGRLLVSQGDADKKIPACTQCHGQALTGALPQIPGLLGLPRDYLNAQLGGWQTGQRRAHAPDCMAKIARQLTDQDVSAVAHWLASQPVPANYKPLTARPPAPPNATPMDCGSAPAPETPQTSGKTTQPSALLAQGEALARAGNCLSCHTAPGGALYAGGRGIETPFGTVFSSNITPDPTHGLGNWSADNFWQAMHHGRSKDGRRLNPAFPYTSFTLMTRADSDALLGYLKTLAPSSQSNQPHALRWPYGTQAALATWQWLYFKPGVYVDDAVRSAEWNRGAYLVRGAGHCGACHTPRNALGASIEKLALSGSMMPVQNWYAPSLLAPREAGITAANQQDTLALLKTGVSPQGSAIGPMADVVRHSTQHLSQSDLRAMAVYLQSVSTATALGGPIRARPQSRDEERTLASGLKNGAALYETHCANCHGKSGEGQGSAYPALSGNRSVTLSNPANLVQVVLYGGYAPSTAGNPRPFGMPPFVLQLNNKNTADLLTFIRNSWGNSAPGVTELEVNQTRDARRR